MKVIRTSAPEFVEPLSSNESESAAISGSPSPSAGASRRAGRGWMPVPQSRTTIVSDVVVGEHLDLERALLAVVGVDDDVGAGLGDGHLHVGDHGGVERERVGHAGQRLAHDADALGARGHREAHLGGDGARAHPRTPARA